MEAEDFLAAFRAVFQVNLGGVPTRLDALLNEPVERLVIDFPTGFGEQSFDRLRGDRAAQTGSDRLRNTDF